MLYKHNYENAQEEMHKGIVVHTCNQSYLER
jgi:hypothetical protein